MNVIGALFRILLVVALLAGVGLVVYAYLGDLSPRQGEVRQPVELDVD